MDYNNVDYLIGKIINKFEETESEVIFYTSDEKITIDKFVPYCDCHVGEYIDGIVVDGYIQGAITKIDKNITDNIDDDYLGLVYKGTVSFFFEHAKINMGVYGKDNGYYGVAFSMPVTIEKINR